MKRTKRIHYIRYNKRRPVSRFFLSLLAIMILLPLIVTALYSFSSPSEIKAFMKTLDGFDAEKFMQIKLAPDLFSLRQYYNILIEDMTVLHYFVNSSMYTLFFLVVALMVLPFQVTMVPNVLTLRALGMLDTPWAVILPMVIGPFYIFLLRQYMVNLPGDMIEAAQIDGAGTIRCYFYIVLPLCRPMLGAAAALSFADCWNLVEQPLIYLTRRTDLYPLSVVFNQLTEKSSGVEFAGATLYTLPALLIYLFFQSDILEGVQLTELK